MSKDTYIKKADVEKLYLETFARLKKQHIEEPNDMLTGAISELTMFKMDLDELPTYELEAK